MLDLIGNTPLVEVNRMAGAALARVLARLESLNRGVRTSESEARAESVKTAAREQR
jgi:cysteine synthase